MNTQQLAKELKELIGFTTNSTSVEVIAKEDSIEILPSEENITKSFYHLNPVVDFCRVKGLTSFARVEVINGKPSCVILLF